MEKSVSVKIDQDLCISCGNCTGIAPEIYELDENGKAKVQKNAVMDIKKAKEGARYCPAGAIIIIDNEIG